MVYPPQFHADPKVPFVRLDDSDLKPASRFIMHTWASSFDWAAGRTNRALLPHEFGLLEPYLAEAAVADHGADFVFSQWGRALDMLCGGKRCGHRLSAFPQPSRSHLRRVSVRAAATRMPAVSRETWALEGNIWRCRIMALPTDGNDFSVTRLLLALLFAPHPIVAHSAVPEGNGSPAATGRGNGHGTEVQRPASAIRLGEPALHRLAGGSLGSLLKGPCGRV